MHPKYVSSNMLFFTSHKYFVSLLYNKKKFQKPQDVLEKKIYKMSAFYIKHIISGSPNQYSIVCQNFRRKKKVVL